MTRYVYSLNLFLALAAVGVSGISPDELRPEVKLNFVNLECRSPFTSEAVNESASWLINDTMYSRTNSLIGYSHGDKIQCALWTTGGFMTEWSVPVFFTSKFILVSRVCGYFEVSCSIIFFYFLLYPFRWHFQEREYCDKCYSSS